MRAHLFKVLFTGLAANTDLRDRMTKAMGINSFREIVAELNQRRVDITAEAKLGWYLRYWKDHPPAYYLNGIAVDRKPLQAEIAMIEGEKEGKEKMMDNLTEEVEQSKN